MIKKIAFTLLLLSAEYLFAKPVFSPVKLYQGNDFMTKEEFAKVSSEINQIKQTIRLKSNQNKIFLFVLISSTVPVDYLKNILIDVGVLQDKNISIETKQFTRGLSSQTFNYFNKLKEAAENLPEKQKNMIVKNFKFKLNPDLFDELNVTKVPALILAECNSTPILNEDCNLKYMIRGDASLPYFFEKIKDYKQQK